MSTHTANQTVADDSAQRAAGTAKVSYNAQRSSKWGVPCWDVQFSDENNPRALDGVHNARDLSVEQLWEETHR